MAGYYDYVLASIPLTLLAVAAALLGSGWAPRAAVPVAGGAAALLVGHALFVNAPAASPGTVRSTPTSAD
ncbi:MAG: hypothetical protein ABEJ34_04575 [Haloferacaceae archaeon]